MMNASRDIIKECFREAMEEAFPAECREYILLQFRLHQEKEQRRQRWRDRIEEAKRHVISATILAILGFLLHTLASLSRAVLELPGVKPIVSSSWFGKLFNLDHVL